LHYLGRLDQQIKLRGFRIEPGEIEGVLEAHEAVSAATVLVRPLAVGGEPQLVAYFTGDEPPESLAEHLQSQLPFAMVPRVLVPLEELPRTVNGEIDRGRLPAPEAPAGESGEAPVGAVEERLAALWTDVLGVTEVDRQSNFFDLGGHSLLVTRLTNRVRRSFGVDLALRSVFEKPLLQEMARQIEGAQTAGEGQMIVPVSRDAKLPLSFAQQRLWFLDRFEPGRSSYNVPFSLRLHGVLKVAALSGAIDAIVEQHEILRTRYVEEGGAPLQVIDPPVSRAFPWVDLRGLEAEAVEQEAGRLARLEAARPFDLSTGPVLRTAGLRLGAEDHVLLATLHHIASDASSVGVFVRTLSQAYGDLVAGGQPQLSKLPVQYADYAAWQHDWLRGEVLDSQLAYWRDQLGSSSTPLELPTDRPRPLVPTGAGAAVGEWLPASSAQGIQELASSQGTTHFMTLLALFQVFLARLTGQAAVSVGSPVANRRQPEVENLIGFFVNTLVLRSEIDSGATLSDLLQDVRRSTLEAYAHQDIPFERLVEELEPVRDLARSPLFQVLLVVEHGGGDRFSLPGLEVVPLGVEATTAKFDLSLFVTEIEGRLALRFEYDVALFDETTITRWSKNLGTLLAEAVERPESTLARLGWLTPAERFQATVEWAETAPAVPGEPLVHRMVEAQASFWPRATAVQAAGSGRLSYGDLDRKANSLAAGLVAAGVAADAPVALCLGRTPDLIVAVLGTLKAGAACLALDLTYPLERLRFMLEDCALQDRAPKGGSPQASGKTVLLTNQATLEETPEELREGPVLLLEDLVSSSPGRPTPRSQTAESLAYLVYTSGSTGRPKGVGMTHGALSNLVRWQRDVGIPSNPQGRTLQFAALSFDVAFQEIFTTLAFGGMLVLVDEETRRDSVALLDHLESNEVETLYLPFVALQQLADTAVATERFPRSLRDVITAGEQLRTTGEVRELFRKLEQKSPGVRLHNHYGPSETHVTTSWTGSSEGAALAQWPALPPIGRAVAGCTTRVLDRRLQPVPTGVIGELYLAARR